jgi:hypothetical protein
MPLFIIVTNIGNNIGNNNQHHLQTNFWSGDYTIEDLHLWTFKTPILNVLKLL